MPTINKFGNMGGGRGGWEREDKYKFKNCLQFHHLGINPLPILHVSFDSVYTLLYTVNKNEISQCSFITKYYTGYFPILLFLYW